MAKKLIIELDISDPSEISEGIFVTHLTHAKLDGSLSFTHSMKIEASVLDAIKKPEEDPIKKLIELTTAAAGVLGFR